MAATPSALADCKSVRDVCHVLTDSVSPQDRLNSLFRGVTDSLRDYRDETGRLILDLRSEVERLEVENTDLRALLQAEQCQRGGNAPPDLIALPLAALTRIREVGYNSQAHRATDTVLSCIRIAEEAIMELERIARRGDHS